MLEWNNGIFSKWQDEARAASLRLNKAGQWQQASFVDGNGTALFNDHWYHPRGGVNAP